MNEGVEESALEISETIEVCATDFTDATLAE